MRKHFPSLLIGVHPFLQDGFFDSPHRFSFRNAGVRDPIQVLVEQSLFVFALQFAPVRNASCNGHGRRG